jgi:hypothetical protein
LERGLKTRPADQRRTGDPCREVQAFTMRKTGTAMPHRFSSPKEAKDARSHQVRSVPGHSLICAADKMMTPRSKGAVLAHMLRNRHACGPSTFGQDSRIRCAASPKTPAVLERLSDAQSSEWRVITSTFAPDSGWALPSHAPLGCRARRCRRRQSDGKKVCPHCR